METRSLPEGSRYAWSEGFDHAFLLAGQVDVPSDGRFHSLSVDQAEAPVKRRYVVIPRETCDVFRSIEVKCPLAGPVLPGPVDVYLGGEFLTTNRLEATPPAGTLELGLGVEQGIKVARNARFREETAGLMGGSLELRHELEIEVRNNLDRNVQLEVRERVPVVPEDQQDDIKLTASSFDPRWEDFTQKLDNKEHEELQGGKRWTLELGAGQSQKLKASYEIRISSRNELVGGNRREG